MKSPSAPAPADFSDAALERRLRDSRALEEAPEHVIQRALATWRPRRAGAPSAPGLLERLRAVLSFDSAMASPLAFGARSTGASVRQLLFSADAYDVDLRLIPAGDVASGRWLLSGQVLGPTDRGEVRLSDAQGAPVAAATLGELGEFRLPDIASGDYVLTVRMGERDIELPALSVREAP